MICHQLPARLLRHSRRTHLTTTLASALRQPRPLRPSTTLVSVLWQPILPLPPSLVLARQPPQVPRLPSPVLALPRPARPLLTLALPRARAQQLRLTVVLALPLRPRALSRLALISVEVRTEDLRSHACCSERAFRFPPPSALASLATVTVVGPDSLAATAALQTVEGKPSPSPRPPARERFLTTLYSPSEPSAQLSRVRDRQRPQGHSIHLQYARPRLLVLIRQR